MKIMKTFLGCLLFVPLLGWSQQRYEMSLEDAQAYALQHGVEAKNAEQDLRAAQLQIRQLTASGLPQVNASASYQNFLKQPVQVIPAEFFGGEPGEFAEVVFGTKQNMSADITASQLIFDGSFFVGLQAARTYFDLAQNIEKKSKVEIKQTIAELYHAALVSKAMEETQASLYESFKNLAFEMEQRYQQGMVESFDRDQIALQAAQFESYWKNAQLQSTISLKMLKLSMGLSMDDDLVLTQGLQELSAAQVNGSLSATEVAVEQTINYRLAQRQMELQKLNVRKEQSKFLPSLNMFLSHQQNAFGQEFEFFKPEQDWFGATVFGVNLSLPIFNSGLKHFNIQSAKVDYEKAKNQFELAQAGLQLELESAKSTYQLKLEVYLSNKALLEVNERVKNTAEIKHEEGLMTSTELIQIIQRYNEAMATYLGSLMELVQAKNQYELNLLR